MVPIHAFTSRLCIHILKVESLGDYIVSTHYLFTCLLQNYTIFFIIISVAKLTKADHKWVKNETIKQINSYSTRTKRTSSENNRHR